MTVAEQLLLTACTIRLDRLESARRCMHGQGLRRRLTCGLEARRARRELVHISNRLWFEHGVSAAVELSVEDSVAELCV